MRFSRHSAVAAGLAVGLTLACGGIGGTGPAPPIEDGNSFDGSAVIGSSGGSVSLGEGVSVDIPVGTLAENTRITISQVATPQDLRTQGAIGQAYRIEPVDLQLSGPVRVSIFVPSSALGGRPINVVTLLRSTDGAAAGLAPAGEELGGVRTTDGGIVSGTTTRLGTFSAATTAAANRAPTADAGNNRVVAVGERVDLSGSGSSDPDGDPLSFSWSVQGPGGGNVAVDNANQASAAFDANQEGVYTATLVVSDGNGGSATAVVRITARAAGANERPEADAGSDASSGAGQSVTLNGSGSSDPDGDPLIFAWRQVSGPTVTIMDPSRATTSFTPPTVGTYVFELTVTDGDLADQDQVTITVTQLNQAPSASLSAPDAVFLGNQVDVSATASDPDGDTLTFQWGVTGPSGPVAFTDDGMTISFDTAAAGAYTIGLTVSDGSTSVSSQATVLANPNVAGIYNSKFEVTSVNGNCGGLVAVGDSETGDLTIDQPSPSVIVIRISELSPEIQNDITATLQGNTVSASGVTITLSDGMGTTINVIGSIRGTITPGAAQEIDLQLDFTALGVCSVGVAITSPPS